MGDELTIMVTGATGAQGGAVVDALLKSGQSVRALVRDPQSPRAKSLVLRGVTTIAGSFEDPDAVREAMRGADGVFSMQMPPRPRHPDSEVDAAAVLVAVAEELGIESFVHTSVARAGDHESFVGWSEGRWWPTYWTSKAEANDIVRSSELPHRVIL